MLSGAQMPGQGGVTRGRGDAEMTWGQETAGDTERFEARTLPEAQYADPKDTIVAGIGAAAPGVEPVAESGGLAPLEASSGRASWKRRLAPHHRRAVQSYFTREGAQ